jgi:adenine-specific DNA-methyltransferase
LSVYISQNSALQKFDSNSWCILNPLEQSIKEKIEKIGTPLKNWDINIYRGVLTGLNEAFIIDGAKKDELIKNDPKSAEIIRPILRGRDIKRYGYAFADKWLINTHNGSKTQKRIDVNNYPAIKEHFDQYYEKLGKRDDQGDTPYNLRCCAYMDDFSKQKIVWGNLNLQATYSFASEEMFVNAPCPMIIPASNYLLAILNSKIADYYIRNLGVTRNGGYFEYKPMFIEKLPVPKPEEKIEQKMKALIEARSYQEIDKLIYRLYDLTEEETAYIEGFQFD